MSRETWEKPHMRRLTATLVALTGLALSASASPFSQEEGGKQGVDPDETRTVWEYLAKRYDADGDGKIAPDEYTRSTEAFTRLDRDKSGFIEEADMSKGGRGRGRRGPRGRGQGQRPEPPQEGELAPDFKLELLGIAEKDAKDKDADPPTDSKKDARKKKKELVQLSKFERKKPVALIFGSYT